MKRAQAARICSDLDFRDVESLAEARALMQALHPHLLRCFSFRVSVPDWDWMVVVTDQCGNMHEGLEALALRIDSRDSEDVAPVPLLTGTFPRLVSITLEQLSLVLAYAITKVYAMHLRCFHLMCDKRHHVQKRILDALRKFHSVLAMAHELKDVYIQSSILGADSPEALV